MALQTELDAFQAAWKQRAGGDVAATIAADNEALLRSGLVERALPAGAKFPDLTLANARDGQTRIYDVLARGPLVVTFYRGGCSRRQRSRPCTRSRWRRRRSCRCFREGSYSGDL